MKKGWVYILHFEEPLAHAKHYAGSTLDLRTRLTKHADGSAARLTEVLAELGRGWVLGGLYEATQETCRAIEVKMKCQKNGPRYCQICTQTPARIEGAQWVSPELVGFPTSSLELQEKKE